MECAWEPWEVPSKPWALDPMLSALGRRSPPARLPMRLTWGDTDTQMLSQGAAPMSRPSLGSPSVQKLVNASTIKETCYPTAPEQRAQSKNQQKKGCWLPRPPHPL